MIDGARGIPSRRRNVGIVVVGLIGFLAAGPLGAVLGVTVVIVGPLVAERRDRRRAERNLGSEVATIFELTARAVRSGVTVSDALRAVAAARPGPAAELVVAAFAGRVPLHGPSGRPDAASTVGVVTAIAGMVGGTVGGTARGLEAGAMILRERERAGWEIAAGIAQARTSALLLGGAPVVLAGAAVVLVPGGVSGLIGHPVTVGALVVGGIAEATGLWWIRRLIRNVEGAAA